MQRELRSSNPISLRSNIAAFCFRVPRICVILVERWHTRSTLVRKRLRRFERERERGVFI
jgi:hypothetical protein